MPEHFSTKIKAQSIKQLLTNPDAPFQIAPAWVAAQWFHQRFEFQENEKDTTVLKSFLQPLESFVFIIQTGIENRQITTVRLLSRDAGFELFDYRVGVTSAPQLAIDMT